MGEARRHARLADLQRDVMVSEFQRILVEELKQLRDDQYPIDVLVLVPDTRSQWVQWVRDALNAIDGLSFIDYVDDVHRRDIPQSNQVRLCTFHSARGVEAHWVVIFGFENLERVAESVGASPRNLGYIVLSRSLFDTTVVLTSFRSAAAKFLETTVGRVEMRQS